MTQITMLQQSITLISSYNCSINDERKYGISHEFERVEIIIHTKTH